MFVVLSHIVYCTLFQQPQETNTPVYFHVQTFSMVPVCCGSRVCVCLCPPKIHTLKC